MFTDLSEMLQERRQTTEEFSIEKCGTPDFFALFLGKVNNFEHFFFLFVLIRFAY